ncbi:MAG: InlB B-repeat-containing protein, partial [Clostridia bacterium]|nr:InlB B-repeat-containing protein [Clostridia bacterium]
YDFYCWTYKGEEISLSPFEITEYSATLKANWVRKQCTVTLDLDGGSLLDGQPSTYRVRYGESTTLPSPTKVGYTFGGWLFNSGVIDFNPFNIENLFEMTVKAKWVAKTYSINLDFNGGELIENGQAVTGVTIERAFNQVLNLPVPSKQGYVFAGYTFNGQAFNSPVWNIEATNPTLEAVWDPISVTYTLVANGAELDVKGGIINFGSSTDTIKSIIPIKKGYNFIGWKVNGESIGDIWNYYPTGSSVSVVASFSPKSYKVTLNPKSGTLLGETEFDLTYGEVYTLPVPTPIEGEDFIGWKIQQTDTLVSTHSGYTVYGYDYSGELTAEYVQSQKKYLIFIHLDGSIEKVEIPSEGELTEDDIPTPKGLTGHEVVWDVSTEEIITATETIEIKAIVNKAHSYIVKFMSGGLELFTKWYQYGSVITLPTEEHENVAKEGYKFLGWSFSSSDKENYISGEYEWTFADTVKLYSVYSPLSYTITYDLTSIPVECSLYKDNEQVSNRQEVLFKSDYELCSVKVEGDLFTVKWLFNGTEIPNTGAWSIASNVTLVAAIDEYKPISISVNVDVNGGTGNSFATITLGKQMSTLTTAPTPLAGKRLTGYKYKDKFYALTDIWDVITYDSEPLVAQYEDIEQLNVVTVRIDLNGGSGASRAQIEIGKPLSTMYPKPTAKIGYKLTGFIYKDKFYALTDIWDVEDYSGAYLVAQYEDDNAFWGPTV